MNNERFFHVMQSPESMDQEDTRSLYDLIKIFPNFQTAHILLLYHLYHTKNGNFDQQLRESAIYIADRKILFNFIHHISKGGVIPEKIKGTSPVFQDVVQEQKKTLELLDFEDNVSIEDSLSKEITFEISNGMEPVSILPDTEGMMELVEEDLIPDPDPNLVHVEEKPKEKPKKTDLISKFIEENPPFIPNREMSDTVKDISEDSVKEPEELATETLALIYTSQKLFEKAIGVYDKLILKFPEKSTYFASRIEGLKKNIK
jgi:hypothetical protein